MQMMLLLLWAMFFFFLLPGLLIALTPVRYRELFRECRIVFVTAFVTGSTLVVSAGLSPREADVRLPDLSSRLRRLMVFQIRKLDEAETLAALQLQSRYRGLDLPDETARWLIKRSRRDLASLYELLDRLDAAALQAKRRLTVPFVKEVLEGAACS